MQTSETKSKHMPEKLTLEQLESELPLLKKISRERAERNLMTLQKYEFFHSPKYLTEELQISKLIGMLYRRPDLDFSLLVKNRNEKQIEELWELHNLVQADIIPTQDLSRYYDNL